MKHLLFAVLGFAALSGELAARRVVDNDSEFRYRGKIGVGKSLEIQGVNGDVIAKASKSGEVEVVAFKKSLTGGRVHVQVSVVEHDGGTTVAALYPYALDAEVRFLVSVPEGIRFVGSTSNGRVDVSGVSSEVDARTTNGDINVQSTGPIHAKAVNGSITVEGAGAQIETVNGTVTLRIPHRTRMELDATTVHGALTANIPFTKLGQDAIHHWHGAVGRGGPRYDLKTVNGDIHLERRRD